MRAFLIAAMLFISTGANAWHPVPPVPIPAPIPIPPAPPPLLPPPPPLPPAPAPSPAPAPKPAPHHGGHHKLFCFYNPAQVLICVIVAGIVVDEVKRTIEGPACATNRMTRRSWFGMVRDRPMLWRPLCKSHARAIRVRG